jgi:hypothetical protein
MQNGHAMTADETPTGKVVAKALRDEAFMEPLIAAPKRREKAS